MQFLLLMIQTAGVGDYFFLILIVAAALIQAFNQNRKKAGMLEDEEESPRKPHPFDDEEMEPVPQQPRRESPYGPLFDQLDEILGEEGVPSVVVEKPKAKPVVKREEKPAETMAAQYLAIQKREMANQMKEGQRVVDPSRIPAATDARPVGKIRSKINMRQAVIYSEILNRKY